ncbi:MAG: LuxR C-terminal-related transcriptional regulator [Burkholderiaceae bacterium]
MFWAPFAAIARGRRFIFYDGRGSGLSEREFERISLESFVEDLSSVVDATGLEQFALFADMPGSPAAISYTARFPQRVERLAVFAGYARGFIHRSPSAADLAKRELVLSALEMGDASAHSAFWQLNVRDGLPDLSPQEHADVDEIFHRIASGRVFAAATRAGSEANVVEKARQIRCATLVVHPARSARVPIEEARLLASLIPDARFLPVDSSNWLIRRSDPVFDEVVAAFRDFLAEGDRISTAESLAAASLTARERDVLELLAQGLDNLQIAAHLDLSEKTVRNRVSMIFDKLEVENRGQAIVKAREAGMGRKPG